MELCRENANEVLFSGDGRWFVALVFICATCSGMDGYQRTQRYTECLAHFRTDAIRYVGIRAPELCQRAEQGQFDPKAE